MAMNTPKIPNSRAVMLKEARRIWPYSALSFLGILMIALMNLIPAQIMKRIIDTDIPSGDIGKTYYGILILCGIPIASTLISIAYNYINTLVARKFGFDIRKRLFLNLMRQPMSFFDTNKSGELTSYCHSDVGSFVGFWLMDIPKLTANIVVTLTIWWILFSISPNITYVQLLSIPFLLVPVPFIVKIVKPLMNQIVQCTAQIGHLLNETFIGIHLIKAACLEEQRINALTEINRSLDKAWKKALIWDRLHSEWTNQTVMTAFTGLGFALGAVQVVKGNLTIGALVAYITYLPKVHMTICEMAATNIQLHKHMAEHEKVFELLALPNETALDVSSPLLRPGAFACNGRVTFEQVTFAYPTSKGTVLQDINFDVMPGEFYGIVGPSGAGKTTILDLLLRYYEPVNGHIFLDGIDVHDIPIAILRKNIALVSQDVFLFSGTLRENLTIVNPNVSEEELMNAIVSANLAAVINTLPDGMDTDLGENGAKLSGGQKQRLSLARALLMKSNILLLDEVTSNIDAASEQAIREAIYSIMEKKKVTVIAIAHRLSFLKEATRILVLEDGARLDEGNFSELYFRSELFRGFVGNQETG